MPCMCCGISVAAWKHEPPSGGSFFGRILGRSKPVFRRGRGTAAGAKARFGWKAQQLLKSGGEINARFGVQPGDGDKGLLKLHISEMIT